MPRLSFVLAVHREQAYLEQCVALAARPGRADVEVVAVDDASPDHGPALLDALAARDPRVRVRAPRRARRAAERRATSGSSSPRGELRLVRRRDRPVWRRARSPRVGERLERRRARRAARPPRAHRRAGQHRPGRRAARSRRVARTGRRRSTAAPGCRPPRRERGTRSSGARCSRARRRFGPAGHGELTRDLAGAARRRADRAPRRSPRYVRRRPPQRDATSPARRATCSTQYDAVFAPRAPECPTRAGAWSLPAMLRHELALLERLPQRSAGAFFAGAVGRVAAPPARRRAAQPPAARRGSSSARPLGAPGRAARRRAAPRARRRRARRGAPRRRGRAPRRSGGSSATTARACGEPIDPDLAVFAAYWYRGYACNPRAIYEKARELVPGMRGVWVVKPRGRRRAARGVEHVVAGTREYYDVIARARVLRQQRQLPQPPRQARGHDPRDDPPRHAAEADGARPARHAGRRARMDFDALLRRCARWDYSVSANALLDAGLGARLPDALRVARGRLPAQRRAGQRRPTTTCARIRAALGIAPGPDRGALRADPPRVPATAYVPLLDLARGRRRRSAPTTCVLARAHYFYDARPAAARAAPRRAASATSPRTRRSRSCASPPTCSSPTTPRSCSTTPCSTARSSSTRPTGRPTARCAARTSTSWRSRPGWSRAPRTSSSTALRSGAGRRRDAARARRVPRALLRARRRPRRRARRPPRLARRARRGAQPARSPDERATAPARPRRRRRPQRHEPARRASSASSASTSRSPRSRPTTPTRAASASRAGSSTSTRALLQRRRVTVNDARPAAWESTGARRRRRAASATSCATWLAGAARAGRRASSSRTRARLVPAAVDGAAPTSSASRTSFVTMLRHPAEILASARKSYGDLADRRRAAPRRGST